jgi:hypothetical protein
LIDEQKKVQELIDKLKGEVLMTKQTSFKEALEELGRIKKQYDKSVKQINTYNAYQKTLEQPVTEIAEVEDFEKKYDVRYKLWYYRQHFSEKQKEWYEENWRSVDAAEILTLVKTRETEITKLKYALPDSGDEILVCLADEVR